MGKDSINPALTQDELGATSPLTQGEIPSWVNPAWNRPKSAINPAYRLAQPAHVWPRDELGFQARKLYQRYTQKHN